MHLRKKKFAAAIIMTLMFGFTTTAVSAGDVILNNNGTGTTTWFITGEASLVMNGFDLSDFDLPVSVDRVSIDVAQPTPGQPVTVVIYQDANGGSPVDATLLAQRQVDITQSGIFTVTFDDPVEVTAAALWVGFYLPVDFVFRADTSGSSVLTYWAWTPASRFDLAQLSSATVLGPGDGSAPVNINMGGIAKITAEIITDGTVLPEDVDTAGTGSTTTQARATSTRTGDLSVLRTYPNCESVLYDQADLDVTYRNDFRPFCSIPNETLNLGGTAGFAQRGSIYDILLLRGGFAVSPFGFGITHCIRPPSADLDRAVIGFAPGSPRQWRILPSARFDNLVCAEIYASGYLSYFVPN